MDALKLLLDEILEFSLVTYTLISATGSNKMVKQNKMAQLSGHCVLWDNMRAIPIETVCVYIFIFLRSPPPPHTHTNSK